MKYPNNILQLRKASPTKVTQTDLANATGTTTQNISHYERGERQLPKSMAQKIADFLKVSPASLYGWDTVSGNDYSGAHIRLQSVFEELKLNMNAISQKTTFSLEEIQSFLNGSSPISANFIEQLEDIVPRVERGELEKFIFKQNDIPSKLNQLNRNQIQIIESMINQMISNK